MRLNALPAYLINLFKKKGAETLVVNTDNMYDNVGVTSTSQTQIKNCTFKPGVTVYFVLFWSVLPSV